MATTSVPVGSLGDGDSPSPWPWKAHQLLQLLPVCAFLAVIAWCAARAVEWAWLRPRRLEKTLRAQGLRGTAYRPPAGDLPLADRLGREARSRPPLPTGFHGIVPRALPLLHHGVTEHGKNPVSWFGPTPMVTLTEPELVRQVLANKLGHFEKVDFGQLTRILHNGLSGHERDKWAKHRRIIKPAFHLEKLKRMLPAFAACCGDMVSRWEGLVAAADGGDGEACEVDLCPEMERLTGDVISRAAFGSSYQEGRRIFELQKEQVHLGNAIAKKIIIPGYMMLPTRTNRRMKWIAAEIEGILRGMIANREKALRAGTATTTTTTSDDLLGLLLESNMEQLSGDGGMSIDDVIGECKLFYFAGMETTSVLLTWTTVLLSMHQDWQDRAREEVLRVFGSGACRSSVPDYDSLSRLKIVTMVLYEVLRLYTPLPAMLRRTYKPTELGGVRYPAGVMFMLPMLQIHHDKDAWGPDADEFRPERFADGIARAASASGDAQAAFIPFSGGPRVCIGQTFAMLEAKMWLAMVLGSFAFELSPSYSHAPFTTGLLRPEHGAQVMIRKLP